MSPAERWKRVQELCSTAEPLDPAAREALLAAEPDAALSDEARQLLGALAAEPAASRTAGLAATPPLPAWIGPYRVTARLGRGGTGTVYAAEIERAGVLQDVAVKVLDAYLDPESAARFRREQQMLARLDHPSITRVFDAGLTEEGRPYLVMEKVTGAPISEYCDQRKLPLAERLRLMIQVCEAVQAAHRRLIVHLDLKPSNILVSQAGQVKLLDFGTAKLVDPDGALTTTRQLTPMYASPEQLRGEPVTTACDVYSLGLVLYELLTGGWPFASRSSIVAVSERAAGTTGTRPLADAVTPAAAEHLGLTIDRARGLLRGDLEVIVSKALVPEPERRYESPLAMAEDLRAHLDQRPVRAQKQTAAYRIRKYAARNSGTVGITAVLLIGLLAAAGTAWWQQQQKVAEGRKALATARFLGWLFQSSNPLYGGRSGMTLLDLAEKAERRLERGDVLDAALASSLQSTFGYLAIMDGRPTQGSRMIAASVERARQSGDPGALLAALGTHADEELRAGRCEAAIAMLKEGDVLLARRMSAFTTSQRIGYWTGRAQVMGACEKNPAGVLAMCSRIEAEIPVIPNDAQELWMPPRMFKALAYNGLANLYITQRKTAEARRAITAGLAVAEREPESNAVQVALYRALAGAEYADGSAAKAAEALGKAVEKMEGGYVTAFEYLRMKVMWAARRAEAGEKPAALATLQDAITQTHAKAAEIGPQRWMIFVDAGFAYYRAGNCDPVAELVRAADAASGGQMPPQWKGNRLAAEAQCLVTQGRAAEARPVAREALRHLQPFLLPTSGLRQRLEAAAR